MKVLIRVKSTETGLHHTAGECHFSNWMEAPVDFGYTVPFDLEYESRAYNQESWVMFVEARQRAETWKPERDSRNGAHYKGYFEDYEWLDVRVRQMPLTSARDAVWLQADKYQSRLGQKDDPCQELTKAIWYLLYLRELYGQNMPMSADIHRMMAAIDATRVD